MRRIAGIMAAVGLAAGLHVTASEATQGVCLFYTPFYRQNLYIVDMETGSHTKVLSLTDYDELKKLSMGRAVFAPDGKSIVFMAGPGGNTTSGNAFYTVRTDGTGLRKVCDQFGARNKGSHFAYTTGGLLWSELDENVYWADVETGERRKIYTLPGGGDANGLWASADGRRVLLWYGDPVEGPIITFNEDFTSGTHIACGTHGHGNWMSLDGTTAIMNLWVAPPGYPSGVPNDHTYYGLFDAETGEYTKVDQWNVGGETGTYTNSYVVNSNDHIVISKGDDFFLFNWKDGQSAQIAVTNKDLDPSYGLVRCGTAWLGELPSLTPPTEPVIALSASTVGWDLSLEPPTPKTVDVSNSGAGTLNAVSVDISQEATSWLTVTLSGSGNAQALTNTIDTAALAGGASSATVTVSGGGASNTSRYVVSVTKPTILAAPDSLSVTYDASDGTLRLSWVDNTSDEVRFEIERRIDTGAFALVASPAADDTSWTDSAITASGTYAYRIRVISADDTSGWSPEAAVDVTMLPFVRVVSPAEGDELTGGSTVNIRWTDWGLGLVQIRYTLNDGETWHDITQAGGLAHDDPRWGNYPWVVPNAATTQAMVRVQEYQEATFGGNSGVFSIVFDSSASAQPGQPRAAVHAERRFLRTPGGTAISFPATARLEVFDGTGRLVAAVRAPGDWHRLVTLPSGCYVARYHIGALPCAVRFLIR